MYKEKKGLAKTLLGMGLDLNNKRAEKAEKIRQSRENRENDPEYQRAVEKDKLRGGHAAEIEYLNNYRVRLQQEKEGQLARIKELNDANNALRPSG